MLLFDLSRRARIEISGRDAREFLHNLCTQEVKNLPVGVWRETFFTTNKARVLAHGWIFHREADRVWLDLPAGYGDAILGHLERHHISERLELANRTEAWGFLRLVGAGASALADAAGLVPDHRHRLLVQEGVDFLRPRDELATVRDGLLRAGASMGDADAYEIMRIEAGLPEMGIDIDGDRLAMEVNRTEQAICYTKGCYLGQETIVMARDRGQVNRLLLGIAAASGDPIAPGTRVYRDGVEVGQATSSIRSARLGKVVALAYLRRGC